MKVSVMTSEESFLNNYGAALQGYALFTTLKKFGHEVQIIRYRGSDPSVHTLYRRLRGALAERYRRLFPTPVQRERELREQKYARELALQRSRFAEFEQEELLFWNKERVNWPQLKKRFPVSDAYVCGSDQIWNPYYKGGHNDPGYFLDFVPAGKRRIAYAPSFGCDSLPLAAKQDLGYYLDRFDFLSVREPEGAELILQASGRRAPVLADPTFLLTRQEWAQLARMPDGFPNRYILCYRFMENDQTKNCIARLSRQLQLPVVSLPLSKAALLDDFPKEFGAGPREFVGLIQNAALVCTDSFHATAFSLLMHTPFYTFLCYNFPGSNTNMNSRVENILQFAGLKQRMVEDANRLDGKDAFSVEFSVFEERLALLREKSLCWLREALEADE